MTDELKRPTLLGGATVVHDERGNAYSARQVEKAFVEYAQMLDPRNGDPNFEEKQRAAQEIMSRQYHKARRAMQDARGRTLEQHAAHLKQFGTGDADYMAKRAYMLEHGLEYNNGTLGYAPSTVHREAAWEATQRLGQAVVDQYKATTAQHAEPTLTALAPHVTPEKTFSRGRILDVIRGQKALWHQRGTDMDKGAMIAFNDVIHTFENLE